ncbi:hypothetical protein [Pendulispora albinea]|uniref:Uncharacterized protein n=1 Tax=Pendulispora albinea TaxID=2741071 RepID=A0ABZ2LVW7_9BACT
MRVASFVNVVGAMVTGFALIVTGCSSAPDPEPSGARADVDVEENVSTQAGICPFVWTCAATGTIYTTRSRCTAACSGSVCEGDYYCRPGCVCP